MTRRENVRGACWLGLAFLVAIFSSPLAAQESRGPNFLAENYELSAYLDTAGQTINSIVKVEFRALDVSQIVRVELHENLEVREVKGPDGKALSFQREPENPMYLSVTLPTPVATGKTVALTFAYGGLLANEENSPVPNVRVASIGKEWAYLLLPARWFPLTNYPANRYTGTFKLNVPDTMAVAGTGKAEAAQPLAPRSAAEGKRLMYTFHCERREPNGSFLAGAPPPKPATGGRNQRGCIRATGGFGKGAGIRKRGGAPRDSFFGHVRGTAGSGHDGDRAAGRNAARFFRAERGDAEPPAVGPEIQRPDVEPAGGYAVVGQPGVAGEHERCLDQRRAGAVFGRVVRGAEFRERGGGAGAGRICGGRACV